eukprot:COSAG05_NODE_280_length_12288_cov_4.797933_21_plen_166_part_00
MALSETLADGPALQPGEHDDAASTVGHVLGTNGDAISSGHSPKMKALFASSLVSPFCMGIGTGACRDIYALKYRASIGALGTMATIHAGLLIAFDLAIAQLQDREMLVFRCFSKERWGRRAPWVLTHQSWHSACFSPTHRRRWSPISYQFGSCSWWVLRCTAAST